MRARSGLVALLIGLMAVATPYDSQAKSPPKQKAVSHHKSEKTKENSLLVFQKGYSVRDSRWYGLISIGIESADSWSGIRFNQTVSPRYENGEKDLLITRVDTIEKKEIFQVAAVLSRTIPSLKYNSKYFIAKTNISLSAGADIIWDVSDAEGIDIRLPEPQFRFFSGVGLTQCLHHPLRYLPFPLKNFGIGVSATAEYQIPIDNKNEFFFSGSATISYGH